MRAVILSAGYGHRMRPLTDTAHKTLIEVGGQTILGRIVTGLTKAGVSEIFVVTGYRAEEVEGYLRLRHPEQLARKLGLHPREGDQHLAPGSPTCRLQPFPVRERRFHPALRRHRRPHRAWAHWRYLGGVLRRRLGGTRRRRRARLLGEHHHGELLGQPRVCCRAPRGCVRYGPLPPPPGGHVVVVGGTP